MILAAFWNHMNMAAQQRGEPLQAMLERLRAMGYALAELDLADLRADPSIPEKLRAAGMGVSSIYHFFDFCAEEPDEGAMRELTDAAVGAACGRVMLIPGFYSEERPEARQRQRARMVGAAMRACDIAARAGLTPLIEDFDDAQSPIRDSAGMRHFLDRIPALRATYDAGNFRFCGEDELTAFDALRAHLAHVHLKDRSLMPIGDARPKVAMDGVALYPCAVGSGVVPMERIFRRLTDMGYDGILTVEHFDSADHLADLEASAAYIRARLPVEA